MKRVELLAPAGDLDRLKIAIRYGANAVYIGGKRFSLRSRASNFDLKDIAEGVEFAHHHDAHVHVTVNMLPHEEDLEGISEYLKDLESIGVDAIIVASLSIMQLAKKVAPKLEVHVSTQHSSTNSSVVKLYESLGMDRVVLARECTLDDVKRTTANSNLPIEAFIHGGMCVSYSGRCTLSNNMTNRDANRGGCAQSCRWKYRLYEGDIKLNEDDHMFSMSSKDLCAMKYIPALIDAGVSSFKIEGRMKSQYYLATIVRTYRMLIDEYYETGSISQKRMQWYYEELSKAENRLSAGGFYGGVPGMKDHLYGINGAGVSQEFIAYVLDYDEEKQIAKLEVRNNFSSGIDAEAFGATTPNQMFVMDILYDEDGEVVDVARNPMDILYTKINVKLKKHDMIRKVIKKRENVY
ncbi:peptidase U32 family protein [Breznakia pachnodae]|uniref:Protease n=1 Tax=Breznakia pachnodae TaxID=265178 RepID=A0ABU0DYX7_9FIRM|nr:U32 family peptidase [Breznakia pachnodae]MDQ0359844.1 putative protease [Breznakia pachnodae]